MQDWIIYTIGFTAQILFASRIIIQWFKSEKANKIKTPVIFWKLSLLGAIMFFIYGYLRRDFSIMLGQAIIYFVFIRNLALQKEWKPSPFIFKFIVIGFPIFAIWYGIFGADINYNLLFSQQEDQGIGTWLLITGIVGQLVYVFRFIYQWIYSEQKQKSSLPLGFWILSLVGSAIVLVYAIYREDLTQLSGYPTCVEDFTQKNAPAQKVFDIEYRHGIKDKDDFKMEPGFENFQEIKKGDLLAIQNGNELRSEWNARIFMPLYQAQGNDGFFVIKEEAN